jgi:hypothetical protein
MSICNLGLIKCVCVCACVRTYVLTYVCINTHIHNTVKNWCSTLLYKHKINKQLPHFFKWLPCSRLQTYGHGLIVIIRKVHIILFIFTGNVEYIRQQKYSLMLHDAIQSGMGINISEKPAASSITAED